MPFGSTRSWGGGWGARGVVEALADGSNYLHFLDFRLVYVLAILMEPIFDETEASSYGVGVVAATLYLQQVFIIIIF